MPDNLAIVGELIPKKTAAQIRRDNEVLIRSFDDILQRPFSEVLLMTFYFAKDQKLQNKICDLIQRCYTQKVKLIRNISTPASQLHLQPLSPARCFGWPTDQPADPLTDQRANPLTDLLRPRRAQRKSR